MEGCYDSKASSAKLFRESTGAWVVNGPTSQNQPVFDWTVWEDYLVSANFSGPSNAANAMDPTKLRETRVKYEHGRCACVRVTR